MAQGKGQKEEAAIQDTFRDYCIRVIRFVSDSALDPHLYFEKKLTGDVMVAESMQELNDILIGLSEWIDDTQSGASRLTGFDQALGREGFPSLSLLCASETRQAGLVLARNRIRTTLEYRLVDKLASDASIRDADRCIAERLLADYAQD